MGLQTIPSKLTARQASLTKTAPRHGGVTATGLCIPASAFVPHAGKQRLVLVQKAAKHAKK